LKRRFEALCKALDLVVRVPDNRDFKEQLLKADVKAGRLYKQTRDPELEALIRKVEETR